MSLGGGGFLRLSICVINGWKNPPLQVDLGCGISHINSASIGIVKSNQQSIFNYHSVFRPLLIQSTVNSEQSTIIPVQPELISDFTVDSPTSSHIQTNSDRLLPNSNQPNRTQPNAARPSPPHPDRTPKLPPIRDPFPAASS